MKIEIRVLLKMHYNHFKSLWYFIPKREKKKKNVSSKFSFHFLCKKFTFDMEENEFHALHDDKKNMKRKKNERKLKFPIEFSLSVCNN